MPKADIDTVIIIIAFYCFGILTGMFLKATL